PLGSERVVVLPATNVPVVIAGGGLAEHPLLRARTGGLGNDPPDLLLVVLLLLLDVGDLVRSGAGRADVDAPTPLPHRAGGAHLRRHAVRLERGLTILVALVGVED